jgi:hypothetical protein
MQQLIDLYQRAVRLCLFKIGPAEMPAGFNLMLVSTGIYFLASLLAEGIKLSWFDAGLVAVLEVVLFLAIIAGLLVLRGRSARLVQTITAMTSTGTVMGVLGIPLLTNALAGEPAEMGTGMLVLLLVFVLWSLMIITHILRHAMEIKPGLAAVISVVILIVVGLAGGLLMAALA